MSVLAAQRTPEEIARASKSSFLVSFGVLPPARRRALTAIYAFCRVADDAADDAVNAAEGRERLRFWRAELERAASGAATTPVGEGIAAAIRGHGVDPGHLHAVLDGVEMDVDGRDFADFAALLAYCDKVAGAVGLACLPVFGVRGGAAQRYAVALGRALQLTNIARDLHADARQGRCYVPRAWLAEAGVDRAVLAALDGARSAGVAAVLDRLVGAAREFFAAAQGELAQVEEPRLLVAPETMAAVYRALLDKIAAAGAAGVFGRRLRVPAWRKAWIAWQTRRRLQ